MSNKFPNNFIWGAATSSYQIEGASNIDGKGKSIWDTFSHTKGKVFNNQNADIATDHYNMYKEDIALMALFLNEFFSIEINHCGVALYIKGAFDLHE